MPRQILQKTGKKRGFKVATLKELSPSLSETDLEHAFIVGIEMQ